MINSVWSHASIRPTICAGMTNEDVYKRQDIYGERGKNGVLIITLFTDAEYEFNKANPKKPYAEMCIRDSG